MLVAQNGVATHLGGAEITAVVILFWLKKLSSKIEDQSLIGITGSQFKFAIGNDQRSVVMISL